MSLGFQSIGCFSISNVHGAMVPVNSQNAIKAANNPFRTAVLVLSV